MSFLRSFQFLQNSRQSGLHRIARIHLLQDALNSSDGLREDRAHCDTLGATCFGTRLSGGDFILFRQRIATEVLAEVLLFFVFLFALIAEVGIWDGIASRLSG